MYRVRVACVSVVALLLLASAGSGHAASTAPAQSRRGMVASPQPDATLAGAEMLAAGGNAVDAAVATAFALAVTDAHHSGLGGGGFLLIRMADGQMAAIDARESAPAAATRDMFLSEGVAEKASRLGGLAVATPGLLRGLVEALEKFGTKSLPTVMAPAIRLAEEGFAVGPGHVAAVEMWRSYGLDKMFVETARIQIPAEPAELQVGWRLVQSDLARTLRRISTEGVDELYRGDLAERIVAAVRAHGGILTMEDLASYETRWREPLRGNYHFFEVLSFPPPSSGGVALIEMLNILEPFQLRTRGAGSSASLHLIAEAMKLAFADRAAYLGDPEFVGVPVAALLSPEYAARQRARINPPFWRRAPWTWMRSEVALRVEGPGDPAAGGGTTHLSVTDAAGNAVAITQTVNLLFGSGITVPGTGIVLNDEMDDFSVAPDTPNAFGLVDITGVNAIAPGKRPLSSMTPTIVTQYGRPVLVAGSPGGPRIITTTLLTLLNVIDYDMNIQQAVSAPRFHHQWVPDLLYVEPATTADVIEGLRARGHHVEVAERNWSSAQAVAIDQSTGVHYGGSDPRGDGIAAGP